MKKGMELALYNSKCSYRAFALFLRGFFSSERQSINLLFGFVPKQRRIS